MTNFNNWTKMAIKLREHAFGKKADSEQTAIDIGNVVVKKFNKVPLNEVVIFLIGYMNLPYEVSIKYYD
jgi:hypothetical protein